MTTELKKKITRLNLGCGSKLLPLSEGWINLDVIQPPEIILENVSEIFSFPYSEREVNEKTMFVFHASDALDMKNIADGSMQEVHAYHVVEHFSVQELSKLLSEIKRILDPDVGCLVIECPNVIKCAKNFLQVETTKNPEIWYQLGLLGFYGHQQSNSPYEVHKWGWYPESLTDVLLRAGFRYIAQQPALTHRKDDRDFRLLAFLNKMPENLNNPGKQGVAASSEVNAKHLTGLGLFNTATGRNEPLLVNPRDSVPEKNLLDNIQESFKMIDRWIMRTRVHEGRAFICSGGPSLKSQVERVKKEFNKSRGDAIFCVKHALPVLLEAGIVPEYCVILDPRPLDGVSTHGVTRKDLFKEIPEKTKFLVASMTNKEVTKYLLSRKADVIGWHAYASGIDRFFHLGIDVLIAGGTSAGMRAINIAYNMGFRDVVLISFDSSQEGSWTPSEKDFKEIDSDGRKKWIQTYYKDPNVKFYSTGELMAQCQDIITTLTNPQDLVFDMWGSGISAEIWKEFKGRFIVPAHVKGECMVSRKVV